MAHSCFYASQRGCRGALSTRWAETLHRQPCSKHKRTLLPRRASPRRQHNHSMNPIVGECTTHLPPLRWLYPSHIEVRWGLPGRYFVGAWGGKTHPKEHCYLEKVYPPQGALLLKEGLRVYPPWGAMLPGQGTPFQMPGALPGIPLCAPSDKIPGISVTGHRVGVAVFDVVIWTSPQQQLHT